MQLRQTDNTAAEIFQAISATEAFRSYVYHDLEGIATLRYGFALVTEGDRWEFNRDPADRILQGIAVIDQAQENLLTQAALLLNQGNEDAAKDLFPSETADISSNPALNTMGVTITQAQGRTIFDRTAAEAVADLWWTLRLDSRLGPAIGDQVFEELGRAARGYTLYQSRGGSDVWLWFWGATEANANRGIFSAVFRIYSLTDI